MTRIYVVTANKNGKTWLVKANNQSQAFRHVAKEFFTVKAATASEVAEAMGSGEALQNATKLAAPTQAPATTATGPGKPTGHAAAAPEQVDEAPQQEAETETETSEAPERI